MNDCVGSLGGGPLFRLAVSEAVIPLTAKSSPAGVWLRMTGLGGLLPVCVRAVIDGSGHRLRARPQPSAEAKTSACRRHNEIETYRWDEWKAGVE